MLYSMNTDITASPYDKAGIISGINMILDAGFPAVDMSLYDNYDIAIGDEAEEYARIIRECVAARGAVINQAHAPFSGYDKYKGEIVPVLPKIIEFAGKIGAGVLVVHPIHGIPYFENKEALFKENIDFYSSLAPYAKRFGVKIGLENMWMRRPVSNFIDDSLYADPAELALAYDTLADPEAFTVCLDIGHVCLCGREPAAAIKILGSRLGALHVHDVDYVHDSHTLPGQGKIDWNSVCRALGEVGYSGDFTLEASCFYNAYPRALYPSALKMMNDVAKYYSSLVDEYKK